MIFFKTREGLMQRGFSSFFVSFFYYSFSEASYNSIGNLFSNISKYKFG